MHKQRLLTRKREMVKEKYKQLCLAHQFGGINTIGFTQTLWASKDNGN